MRRAKGTMRQSSNQFRTRTFKPLTGERTIELRAGCLPSGHEWQKSIPNHSIGVTQLGTEDQRATKRPASYDHGLQRAPRSRPS
jgi:hypothetical protein